MSGTTQSIAEIDWQVVAGAIATFIATTFVTYKGWKDRKKEITQAPASSSQIVGGMIQESVNMAQNTASMVDLREEVKDMAQEVRMNTAALNRLSDVLIMTGNSSRR